MKLRIQGNSLRLRLNQSEVSQFSKTGYVEDAVQFAPGSSLSYTLESISSLTAAKAAFANGSLRILVPGAEATDWACSDRVDMTGSQPLESGKSLSILIEKDFQCLHGADARDPDAYPNPLEEAASRN